jgi:predicted nucleic acid-binding protein
MSSAVVVDASAVVGYLQSAQAPTGLDSIFDDRNRLLFLPLLGRIFELRDNVSPYDAAYVALYGCGDASRLMGRLSVPTAPR